MTLNRTYIWLLMLSFLCIPALMALCQPGFYTSHDGYAHLSKIYHYTQALKDGQWPPRWAGTLSGHLGYPLFVLSYHLPFILASVPYILGFSLPASLKLIFGVSFAVSGVGAFLWLKEFFDNKSSFVGALFFLYAPYRFILMYVRAAAGEVVALAILPFVFFLLTKTIKEPSPRNATLLAFVFGLGIIAHSLFLPMYLPFIFSYAVMLFYTSGYKTLKEIFMQGRFVLYAFILGLGLSAFNLLPQIFERQFTVFDNAYRNRAFEHLVELYQLIRSPWGFGMSHLGTAEDAMSFQIGLTQLLVFCVTVGLLFFALLRFKILKVLSKRIHTKIPPSIIPYVSLSVVWFLLAAFLMLNISPARWIWQHTPFLSVIDIPWRYLGMTTIACSFMAAFVISVARYRWFAVIVLACLVLFANRNHWRINEAVFFNDSRYIEDTGTTTYQNEYRPRWRKSYGTTVVNPRLYSQANPIKILSSNSRQLIARTNFADPTLININILYFPGWDIFLKNGDTWAKQAIGEKVSIVTDNKADWTEGAIDGTMQFIVPSGPQVIKTEFNETPLRLIADYISLISIIIILLILLLDKIKKIIKFKF